VVAKNINAASNSSLVEFEIGHGNLVATMIAPPHEFDFPCRFMIGELANEQMLGWLVALNAAALLRRVHLRKELLHACEHESVEGTFGHLLCLLRRNTGQAARSNCTSLHDPAAR
jgi:hypothetical protein